MKKITLFAALFLTVSSVFAQRDYTISGGVLGGANFSTLKNDDVDFKYRFGFDAGIWANFPLGSLLSVEPQVMYSQRAYHADISGAGPESTAGYISFPVFLKVGLGNSFAIMAGPEFNLLTSLTDKNNNQPFQTIGNDGFKKHSTAITGGVEFAPHSRFVIYARYNYGLVDMYRGDDGNTAIENNPFKNQSIHVGLKYKIFGHEVATKEIPQPTATVAKPKPAPKPAPAAVAVAPKAADPDSDGDGIVDSKDSCPKTAGFADNYGCPEVIAYFKRDVAELNDEDKADLEKVLGFLNRNPNLNVFIEGHTSTLGADDYNLKLSERRADQTVEYLVSKGIARSRMTARGYGEKYPVGDNETEAGRAASRRVVVKINK